MYSFRAFREVGIVGRGEEEGEQEEIEKPCSNTDLCPKYLDQGRSWSTTPWLSLRSDGPPGKTFSPRPVTKTAIPNSLFLSMTSRRVGKTNSA